MEQPKIKDYLDNTYMFLSQKKTKEMPLQGTFKDENHTIVSEARVGSCWIIT